MGKWETSAQFFPERVHGRAVFVHPGPDKGEVFPGAARRSPKEKGVTQTNVQTRQCQAHPDVGCVPGGKGLGSTLAADRQAWGQTGAQVPFHLEDTLFLKSAHLPGLAPPTLAPGDLSRPNSQGSIQG